MHYRCALQLVSGNIAMANITLMRLACLMQCLVVLVVVLQNICTVLYAFRLFISVFGLLSLFFGTFFRFSFSELFGSLLSMQVTTVAFFG